MISDTIAAKLADYRNAVARDNSVQSMSTRLLLEAAIEDALQAAYEDAEDILQRYIQKQDHQHQTVYEAVQNMITSIRLRAQEARKR